jgi:hypothetical protein
MAGEYDDLVKSLQSRGYLNAPGKSTAPSSPDTPPSDDESWLKSVGMAIPRAVKGAGKELAGEAIGLGQLVPGSSSIGEYIPHGQNIKDWAMAPSESWAETAGSVVGGALPWLLTPEARAGTMLAKLVGSGLRGGIEKGTLMGAAQPTESGSYGSKIPGSLAGAITGGAMGRLGGKAANQRALAGFQKHAYDAVLAPLRSKPNLANTPGTTQIGAAGLKELDDAISRLESNKFITGKADKAAIAEARANLDHLHQSRTGEWVDPHGILDYFERNKQLDINHPLRNAAELGRRAGVPPLNRPSSARSWAAYPLSWALHHVVPVPGLHTAVHAGLHNLSRQTAGRGAMDELGWLARNADYVRRFGSPLATSPASQATTNVMRGGGGGIDYGAIQDPGQDQQ